jgi:hypothetical protein
VVKCGHSMFVPVGVINPQGHAVELTKGMPLGRARQIKDDDIKEADELIEEIRIVCGINKHIPGEENEKEEKEENEKEVKEEEKEVEDER